MAPQVARLRSMDIVDSGRCVFARISEVSKGAAFSAQPVKGDWRFLSSVSHLVFVCGWFVVRKYELMSNVCSCCQTKESADVGK